MSSGRGAAWLARLNGVGPVLLRPVALSALQLWPCVAVFRPIFRLSATLSANYPAAICLCDLDLQKAPGGSSDEVQAQWLGRGRKYWKKSHKAFYCVVVHPDRKREERRLGDDANQAEGLRAEIIAAIRREGTPSPDSTVRDLCFQFLDQSKANNSHKTYLGYCTYLKSFCESLPPSLRVREMLKAHLENWLTKPIPRRATPTPAARPWSP